MPKGTEGAQSTTSSASTTSTTIKSPEQIHVEEIYNTFAHIPENEKDRLALEESRRLSAGTQDSLQEGFKSGAIVINEFIQNANDSVENQNTGELAQPNQKKIEITITLIETTTTQTDNYFIFSHTGKHFDRNDVIRICRIRDHETKGKQNQSGAAGYKGVGRNAAYIVGEALIVVCDAYQFRFDKQFVENNKNNTRFLPWKLMPIWTPKESLPEIVQSRFIKGAVNFAIKLTVDGVKKIKEELSNLQQTPEHLLFLKNIRKITLLTATNTNINPTKKITLKSNTKTTIDNKTVEIEIERNENSITITSGEKTQKYLTTTFQAETLHLKKQLETLEECPPRLQTGKPTSITFAIELEQSGIIKKTKGLVYATLPLPKTGTALPFHVNADFLPDTFRTHLIENFWNNFLWHNIACCNFILLASLAKDPLQNRFFLRALALKQCGLSGDFQRYYEAGFDQAVRDVAFIPAYIPQQPLLKVSDALIDTYGFFAKFAVNPTDQKALAASAIEDAERLSNELKVSKLTSTELMVYVTNYLAQQADPLKHQAILLFLQALCSKGSFALDELKKTRLIWCTDNSLDVPSTNIYIDSNVPTELAIALSLKFIKAEILDTQSILSTWLVSLGLQTLTPENLIIEGLKFIGKINYLQPNAEQQNFILVFTRYLFRLHLTNQLNEILLDRLIKELKILTQHGKLQLPTQCYLANSYHPEQMLQDEDALPTFPNFVSSSYVQVGDDIQQWKRFFIRLKVHGAIRMEVINSYERSLAEVQYPHPRVQAYFKDNVGKPAGRVLEYLHIPLCDLLIVDAKNVGEHAAQYEVFFWQAIMRDFRRFSTLYKDGTQYVMGNNSKKPLPAFLRYFLENNNVVLAKKNKENDVERRYKINELYAPHLADAIGNLRNVADLPVNLSPKESELLGLKVELSITDCLDLLTQLSLQEKPSMEQYEAIFRLILDFKSIDETKAKCKEWAEKKDSKLPAQSNEMRHKGDLRIINIADPDFEHPADSSDLIKQFDGLSSDEMLQLADFFGIDPISPKISYATSKKDNAMKQILWDYLLPVIAIIQAHKNNTDALKCLKKLRTQFKDFEIIKTTGLSQKINNEDTATGENACLESLSNPILYYQLSVRSHTRQASEATLPIDSIAQILINFFDLKLKKSTMIDLLQELLGQNLNEIDFESWLKKKKYKPDNFKELVSWHHSNQAESTNNQPTIATSSSSSSITSSSSSSNQTSGLPSSSSSSSSQSSATVQQAEIDRLSDDLASKATISDSLTSKPKPAVAPSSEKPVAPAPSASEKTDAPTKELPKFITSAPRRQDVFFKQALSNNVARDTNSNVDAADDDDSDDDNNASQPNQHSKPKNPRKEMSQAEKTAIGGWGETAVFVELISKYKTKIEKGQGRFAGCILEETPKGFKITKGQLTLLECTWNNKKGMGNNLDYEESEQHYDFKIVKSHGKDGLPLITNRTLIIEVKSTKENRASIAHLKIKEIEEMRKAGDRYRLYRLYGAGNQDSYKIKKIKPHQLPIKDDQPEASLFKVELKI